MRKTLFPLVALSLVLALAFTGVPALAGSNSAQLPGGANVTVSIESPETCTELLIPTGETARDVVVEGTAGVGAGAAGANATALVSLSIEVDGGGMYPISNDDIEPDLPQPGAVEVRYETTVPGLGPGDHEICVTAEGSDSDGSANVTQCETIHLLQITLEPENETNELGTADQTHTVTATILGPASGPASVEGREVTFQVVSGPNAGNATAATTDSGGNATFTYTAEQGLAGVGTDIIQACFTLASGEVGCAKATKTWVDSTPPEVDCIETVNPHGNNVPGSGKTKPNGRKGGQNEDGFYELIAADDVDPDPDVYVVDTGSETVFGPFSSGTRIKYTEAPGATPAQKKMGSANGQAGAITWHIIGNGDACVSAVDSSGNEADCVSCLVPPPPK